MGSRRMPWWDPTTTTLPREAIVRMGPLLGDDTIDLVIGILRVDPGSCMSRLPMRFALVFLGMLSRLLLTSMIADDNRT
jgi:hypothetical protein